VGRWDFQTNLLIVGVVGETKSTVYNKYYNSILWRRGPAIPKISNRVFVLILFYSIYPTQAHYMRNLIDQPRKGGGGPQQTYNIRKFLQH
jgi:hypothetical protein